MKHSKDTRFVTGSTSRAAVLTSLGMVLASTAVGQTIWSGGGANDFWSTGANWTGGAAPANDGTATVQFAGTTRLTPVLDAAWNILGLQFAAGAGAFSLSGSGLTLGSGGINIASTLAQTISAPLTLAATQSFTATSGNLTVSGPISLGPFSLTLNSAATARTITLSGGISGTGGLTKSGTGVLALTGANTYSGQTTLSAGTTQINSGNALGTGTLRLAGGRLDATAASTVANAVTLASNSTLGGAQTINFTAPVTIAGTASLTVSNTALTTFSGGIAETGAARAFTKAGAGNLLVTGPLSYTGATTISGGTLALTGSAVLPGTNLALSGGILASSGALARDLGTAAGQLRWTGTASGGFAARGGDLTVSGITGTPIWGTTANFLGTGASLLLNSALADSVVTWTSDFSLGTATRTISVADNTAVTTDRAVISGAISGTGGLTRSGTGTLDLTGSSTYTGQTWLQSGVTRVPSVALAGVASPLGAATGVNAPIRLGNTTSTATLLYNGTGHTTDRGLTLSGSTGGATLQADGTGAFQSSGPVTADAAGAKTLTLTGASTATNNTLSGVVSNGSGTLAVSKTGTTTWVLSGSNTYTGNTTVSAGTLSAGSNTAFGTGTLVPAGGTISASGAARALSNTVLLSGNSTIGGSLDLTFNGAFSQTGANRTLTISNTGLTTFAGPSFQLAEANTARVLALSVATNALISSIISDGTGTGADGLTKSGVGTLTLTGLNTYTGGTTVSAGTLAAGTNSALGTGTLTLGGGTLAASGSARTFGNTVLLSANSTLGGSLDLTFNGAFSQSGGNRTLTISNTGLTTFSGPTFALAEANTARVLTISPAGSALISSIISDGAGTGADGLTKAGTGTLTLAGLNTYTGATTLSAGTLLAGTNSAFGSGTLTLAGGTLGGSGGARSLANTVLLSANATIGGASDITFSGGFSQSGGNRTLTVSNTGITTFSSPTFALAENNATRTFTMNVAGQAVISGSIQDGAGTGADAFTKTGVGTLTFSGNTANTSTGTITISAGTLRLAKTAGVDAISAPLLVIGDTVGADVLTLGASHQISSGTVVRLNGGTFNVAGFLEAMGALDVDANSTINMGGGTGSLEFAASNTQTWGTTSLLTITNYTYGQNSLRFGTNPLGLTGTQLNQIRFANYANDPGVIDSSGYVIPLSMAFVPEPAAAAGIAGACALALGLLRRRRIA